MKKRRPLLLTALAIATLSTPVLAATSAFAADTATGSADAKPSASASDWTLQDDVDLSDASRWSLETGQADNTLSYDLPRNVRFSSDGLTVSGKRESYNGRSYTSGDAKGTDIVIPNYARVEAVGSSSYGEGLWPALMWLRPLDSADGEIDLMEVFGADKRVSATIHNQYGSGHRNHQGSVAWSALPNTSPTAEHRYVMEKTPDRIVISVDGKTMLDAGPEDVPAGFDWDRIFERPGATWYPRVTMQIGCGPAFGGCTLGSPAASWKQSETTLSSLRVWKWTPGSGTSDPAPGDTAPGDTAPGDAPADREATGSATLAPGQELTRSYPAPAGGADNVNARFTVPSDLGSSAFYPSVDLVGSGTTGYRATAVVKAKGNLYLTVYRLDGRQQTAVAEKMVLSDGAYRAGDRISVDLSRSGDDIRARAWVAGDTVPGWQLSTRATTADSADTAARVTTYLSRSAVGSVRTSWTVLSD